MSGDERRDTAVRNAAQRLMSGFSIEVTPREADALPAAAQVLGPGTAVYVTYLPAVRFAQVVATAVRARGLGLRPVVHVAARAVPDLPTLDRLLGRLADVGVADILLIAGSAGTPAGSLADTLQVLESDVLHRRHFAGIGVAGHPEGNPLVDPVVTDDALARKNAIATEFGLPLYLVTQFCFAAEPVVAWERRIRDAGNALPVHVGLPGLSTPARLIAFGLSCGIGPSLGLLRKQAGNVLRLATRPHRPAGTVAGIARAVAADGGSRITSCHFFPFGAIVPTAEWAGAIRDGRFALTDDGGLATAVD